MLYGSAVQQCCSTVLCYFAVLQCCVTVLLCCALPLALLCCAMPCRGVLCCESFSSLLNHELSLQSCHLISYFFFSVMFLQRRCVVIAMYHSMILFNCVTQNAKLVTLKGIVEGTASIYCTWVLVQKYCSMLLIKLCQHKNRSRLIIILDFRHLNTFFPRNLSICEVLWWLQAALSISGVFWWCS